MTSSTSSEKEKHAEPSPLRVAIIGAGVGGLILAQLLKQNPKFQVTVYERGTKHETASSLTGFRILLSKEMLAGLRARLPEPALTLLNKAIGITPKAGQSIALLDQKGKLKLGLTPIEFREASSVSRWKFRAALLEGLDDIVQWESEFVKYVEKEGQNEVDVIIKGHEDAPVTYDLVVGADGAGSKVRKQLRPDSKRDSLGITVLYFKMPLTRETELMMPFGTGCMVMAPRSSMVVSYYKDASAPYGPYSVESINPDDSYLMCGLGCYTDDYVKSEFKKHPDNMTPEELKAFWQARAKSWHPLFRSLVGLTIPSTVYVANVKTQHPFDKPPCSNNVVILGDAAHSMTPYLGKGATSAIADALLLADHLEGYKSAEAGGLKKSLDEYTKGMIKSGFGMQKKSKTVHDVVFWGDTKFKAHLRNGVLRMLGVFIGSKAKETLA